MRTGSGQALIIVDMQNDFMDGGALAVPGARDVIAPINALAQRPFDAVIATQDWHPQNHCSFIAQGGPWPTHCVAGTADADFPPGLDLSPITHVVRKGIHVDRDSYSAFLDNDRRTRTGLDGLLKELDIQTLTICGLALDYCVSATALDAAELGYTVRIVTGACRAISTDHAELMERFQAAGIRLERD